MKIRLQAGFEPSTLSVQNKSFLRSTHFTTAALPLLLANSSYYNKKIIMQQTYLSQPARNMQGMQTVQNTCNSISNQAVMDTLEQIDSKLRKLDSIETQLKDMSGKLSQIEDRVSSLESKSLSTNSKLTEIEASRHYDSQTCDEIRRKQSEIDASIRTEKQRNEQASKHIESLRHENKRLSEDLIDMQARSMRDNLIFFNFKEPHTADERRAEDCTKIIVDFCENTLRIPDVRTSVKIDRAHTMVSYYVTSTCQKDPSGTFLLQKHVA